MSRIIVKNLPNSGIDSNVIKEHFADIDNVTDVKLNFKDTGKFRRFAFVGFKSKNGAERAIEKLNNSFIKNSRIVLEPCKSMKEIKPEKVGFAKKSAQDEENAQHEGDKKNNESSQKKKAKYERDVFEEVKDDPEFKEFLNLQRNIGENHTARQIWADDAKMESEPMFNDNGPESGMQSDQEDGKDTKATKLLPNSEASEKPKKKHKRSRGKKKPAKTQPKELFIHTIKISGFPQKARRKDIKDFFKPLEVLSVRNNKRDEVCYVSFKDESDLKFAMRKNLQFFETSRIRLWRHNVERSRIFKDRVKEKVRQKEETIKKYEASMNETESIEESGRLFIRNLNYTCTQQDLEEVFSPYGEITEIHFPIDKQTSLPKGYAYVEFMFPKNALKAYEELNGTIFQGRNFHLIPSKPKPEPRFRVDGQQATNNSRQTGNASSYKREQLAQQKQSAPRGGSNWNILFLGQNALADVVSDMRGVEKSKMLTHQTQKEPIAVRMALGDAQVVEEMRKFLVSNGVELDSFDNPQAKRSNSVIIAKNLPASTTKDELMSLFEPHGRVARVIIPPNGLTAIVDMEEPVEAKNAFRKLAYSKFKDSLLYLEWAPMNVFGEKSLEEQERSDLKQLEQLQTGTKILVKNVPFEATVQELRKIFAAYGELNFVRIPKKIDGQHRGFGFVDYLTKEDAMRAFKPLCHSTHLYGRKLILEWAKVDQSSSNNKVQPGSMQVLADN